MNPDEMAPVAPRSGVARAHASGIVSHLLNYLVAHFADRVAFIGRNTPATGFRGKLVGFAVGQPEIARDFA